MNYEDYFKIHHSDETVSMDEFIAEAMRTDIHIDNSKESFNYLSGSRITLRNEILTCYQFLKEKSLLEEYHEYRDGE